MKLELNNHQANILKHAITSMQLELCGYQIESLKQALQDSDTMWENRIQEAENGDRSDLSIDGARMMQNDLRDILAQLNGQSSCWRIFR